MFIHKEHKEEKTANQDIQCYKYMYEIAEGKYLSCCRPVQFNSGEYYKLNKKMEVKNRKVKYGYHSYSQYQHLKKYAVGISIVECFIPTGSKYYFNPTIKMYVSDEIIIGEKLF